LIAAFGLSAAPLPINTVAGMAWVEGLTLAPLFFLMTGGAFRSMDPALEEAARMAGATSAGVVRRVLAPLFFPAVLAAAIFVFTTALGAFDVPGTIGLAGRVLTFSTYLYVKTSAIEGLPNYGLPAAFGTCMLVFSGIVSLFYTTVLKRAHRYQVVTGKAYRPRLAPLGRLAWLGWGFAGFYVLCALVTPLLLVVWAALLPFYQPPSARAFASLSFAAFSRVPWELVLRGIGNSLVLAVVAPTLAIGVSLCISWIVLRSRTPGRLALDTIAFLPHAVPGIVFALGAVLIALFAMPRWAPLYGSLTLIIVVCATGWIAFSTRVVNASLMQIHSELEEAGLVSGAGRLTILRRVLLPLMWPALASAWVWLALLALRELTRAVILSTADNTTLPVITWSLWNGGQINQAAVIVLVSMALFTPLLVLYFRLATRARASAE
jgi:iron(III) transport system permease protein